MPPRSESRWANLVFDGKLPDMLEQWKAEGMSYEKMTDLINADLARRAAKIGDEPIVLHRPQIGRWLEQYGIG